MDAALRRVAIFAERLSQRRPVTIHGDGEQSRDFVHVEDVVDAIIAIAEAPQVGTWDEGDWMFLANELVGHLEAATAAGDVEAAIEDLVEAAHARVPSYRPVPADSAGMGRVLELLATAARPVIVAGGGVRASGASAACASGAGRGSADAKTTTDFRTSENRYGWRIDDDVVAVNTQILSQRHG